MANIKSAKKRIRVTEKKTLYNKIMKSRTKTAVKKVVGAVEQNNQEDVQKLLKDAVALIDKATSKGIYHKNTASRKKSKLVKKVNTLV